MMSRSLRDKYEKEKDKKRVKEMGNANIMTNLVYR